MVTIAVNHGPAWVNMGGCMSGMVCFFKPWNAISDLILKCVAVNIMPFFTHAYRQAHTPSYLNLYIRIVYL